jgi:hypothetical protein
VVKKYLMFLTVALKFKKKEFSKYDIKEKIMKKENEYRNMSLIFIPALLLLLL